MKLHHIFMVVIFSIGMGIGQLLLKFSAQRQSGNTESVPIIRLFALFGDWVFLIGIILYAIMLVYWVWVLTFLPLSRAYPFTILSVIVAGIGGAVFFGEHLTLSFFLGSAIIGLGLVIVSLG